VQIARQENGKWKIVKSAAPKLELVDRKGFECFIL